MMKSEWDGLPKDLRNAIVATFKMAGIDFEQDHVTPEKVHIPESTLSPWMTRAEAARYAYVSTDTIDNWCAEKYIEHAKLGTGKPGRVLVDKNSLEKFLRSKCRKKTTRVRKQAPSIPGGYRVKSEKH